MQEGILDTCNIATVQGQHYTKRMSAALGGYVKEMREGRGLRPVDVLAQLSERLHKTIDESRLWRVETGKAWPDGDFLAALLDIIRADIADVGWIQQHPDATAEDGQQRARERLSASEQSQLDSFLVTDEGQLQLLRAVARLSDDPELRGRIRGYLDALEGERSRQLDR